MKHHHDADCACALASRGVYPLGVHSSSSQTTRIDFSTHRLSNSSLFERRSQCPSESRVYPRCTFPRSSPATYVDFPTHRRPPTESVSYHVLASRGVYPLGVHSSSSQTTRIDFSTHRLSNSSLFERRSQCPSEPWGLSPRCTFLVRRQRRISIFQHTDAPQQNPKRTLPSRAVGFIPSVYIPRRRKQLDSIFPAARPNRFRIVPCPSEPWGLSPRCIFLVVASNWFRFSPQHVRTDSVSYHVLASRGVYPLGVHSSFVTNRTHRFSTPARPQQTANRTMQHDDAFALLLTWTTYGSWLPGDPRGHVSPVYRQQGGYQKRQNIPGTPLADSAEPTADLAPSLHSAARHHPPERHAVQCRCRGANSGRRGSRLAHLAGCRHEQPCTCRDLRLPRQREPGKTRAQRRQSGRFEPACRRAAALVDGSRKRSLSARRGRHQRRDRVCPRSISAVGPHLRRRRNVNGHRVIRPRAIVNGSSEIVRSP